MVSFDIQRKNMVESQVRPSDVTDTRLIRAMAELPRERFLPPALAPLAYMDEPIALGEHGKPARGYMAPRAFAKLVNAAQIDAGDSVLDLGALTGYSTAVLSRLAGSVVAIEPDAEHGQTATRLLADLGITNAKLHAGSLCEGRPQDAPFAVILLQGAVSHVPAALLDQLEDRGRLLAIVTDRKPCRAAIWRRTGSVFSRHDLFEASAPPLPGFEKAAEFVF